MIEIDGVAYPLEPGKQYLIAVDRRFVSEQVRNALPKALEAFFGVKVIVIATHKDPRTCVRMIAVEEPERG